jgi:hypothetical protein
MKKQIFYSLVLLQFVVIITGCSQKPSVTWQPAKGPLSTQWTSKVVPENIWPEYPRPQLARNEWLNLNGPWEYAIVAKDSIPMYFQGQILVPFPVESALSGVGKLVGKDKMLWYKRDFKIPDDWKEKTILLHFEGVDWETEVWIDGKKVGNHKGGYDPFSFEISQFINSGNPHELLISVWDPTDEGFQPHGKQVNKPGGIFYTPSTGIWQTVWLEPVPKSYIEDFTIITDIDNSRVLIKSNIQKSHPNDLIEAEILDNGRLLATKKSGISEVIAIQLSDPVFWSPENPFLYGLKIRFIRDAHIMDEVDSYFGMRKISVLKDNDGFNKLALNNKILFQSGPLDQGFWPDGIYTPPCEEAMRYDIEMIKKMGFNMLRKHVKVENRRFYYWCDKLGIMVWQDMPSANGYVSPGNNDLNPSAEHKEQFETELKSMIMAHHNHPSIVMWVPFNEGWGQYDTKRIVDLVYALDSTRLVNNTSGWEDRGAGDVLDIHHYPEPECPKTVDGRATVLGEFGGLGFYTEGHTWQKENWGYEKMQSRDDLLIKFENFYKEINQMKEKDGLAAAVYTQTTDVETETNGLMTYDRYEVKMGIENIVKAQSGKIPPRLKSPIRDFIENITIDLVTPDSLATIYLTLDGAEPGLNSKIFSEPITIYQPTIVKAICGWPNGNQSRTITYEMKKSEPRKAIKTKASEGLKVHYYEGNWEVLPDFHNIKPVKSGVVPKAYISFSGGAIELFGMQFEGFLDVPETDVYILYLSSDDGAILYLDSIELINYDGIHGAGVRTASVALEKGLHPIRLDYFQRYGELDLKISWESLRMKKSEISESFYRHN